MTLAASIEAWRSGRLARDIDALRGALTRLIDNAPLCGRFGLPEYQDG